MLPFFREHFGNPASRQHAYGWRAEEAVKIAREQVAGLLGAAPREIVFTSGATESCNLGLKGVYGLYQGKGKHIITVATEHKAVLDTCKYLETQGVEITYLLVDNNGNIDLEQLEAAIRDDTILVAVMWANNETGIINEIGEIGKLCKNKGVLLFSDATQAIGKIPVEPKNAGVHLLAMSAHKYYGPKGVGALYVSSRSPRVKLTPLIHGGGHEEGLRSGTLNVPGIVGFGKSMSMAPQWMRDYQTVIQPLRDILEKELLKLPGVHINGDIRNRLPHVSNLRFDGIDASALMTSLSRDVAMASGSACTSANPEPSHVLTAMGMTTDEVKSSLRLSLGARTTRAE